MIKNKNICLLYLLTVSIIMSACGGGSKCCDELNESPVAFIKALQEVQTGDKVELSGVDSYDVDSDTMNFFWAQVSGPGIEISGLELDEASFVAPDTECVIGLTLVVSDGQDESIPATIEIKVVEP